MTKTAHIFLTLCLILFCYRSIPVFALEVGDPAPYLEGINAHDSKRLNLFRLMVDMRFKEDAEGQPLVGADGKYISVFTRNVMVLNFFARSCIPCIREIPTYNRIAESFAGKEVKMVYVNVDPDIDQNQILRLIKKYQIKIPVLMPNQNEVMRTYNAKMLPLLVIIDKQRKIAYKLTGFNENLESDLTRIIQNLLAQN
ncbi:TlpA family protein disulfide reductase [bacterium]|nr:TlpA family protein disulfide reductase [bacterium]